MLLHFVITPESLQEPDNGKYRVAFILNDGTKLQVPNTVQALARVYEDKVLIQLEMPKDAAIVVGVESAYIPKQDNP